MRKVPASRVANVESTSSRRGNGRCPAVATPPGRCGTDGLKKRRPIDGIRNAVDRRDKGIDEKKETTMNMCTRQRFTVMVKSASETDNV